MEADIMEMVKWCQSIVTLTDCLVTPKQVCIIID